MKHHSLLSLLFVSAASVAAPCRSQSPATGGPGATRLGGVLIRITEVPFDRPDYVNHAEREIENRFRHAAPNESRTAQVAARIRRDGTIAGTRVVSTSGDSAFDNQAGAGVSGEVLAQFVVDTMGIVDTTTVKVLRSSHPLFTHAVVAGMSRMYFDPAEVGGRKVKQLVQQPFTFSVASSKDTNTAHTAPAARSSAPPKRPATSPSAGSPSSPRPPG